MRGVDIHITQMPWRVFFFKTYNMLKLCMGNADASLRVYLE
jgi:hypothetical protein